MQTAPAAIYKVHLLLKLAPLSFTQRYLLFISASMYNGTKYNSDQYPTLRAILSYYWFSLNKCVDMFFV